MKKPKKESEKMQKVTIRLYPDELKKLQKIADAKTEGNLAQFVRSIIRGSIG